MHLAAEIGTSGGAKAYKLGEVVAATSNFKTEIGKGGFGPVFHGKFPDGREVAVKVSDGPARLGRGQSQGVKEFFNEVIRLSSDQEAIDHPLLSIMAIKSHGLVKFEFSFELGS